MDTGPYAILSAVHRTWIAVTVMVKWCRINTEIPYGYRYTKNTYMKKVQGAKDNRRRGKLLS